MHHLLPRTSLQCEKLADSNIFVAHPALGDSVESLPARGSPISSDATSALGIFLRIVEHENNIIPLVLRLSR